MRISIGIDAAKEVHWVTAVTQDGRVLLDRKLENSAEDIRRLVAELAALGGERLVGIDLLGGIATLVSAMLLAAGERLVHVPGLAVNRARQGGVGGQAKSDPKDARVIADQLRLRAGDFRPVALESDAIAELRLLRQPAPRSRHRPDPARQPHALVFSTPSIPTWSAPST